ncbi:MAG: formate dehydrogenase subunit delta [Erythrobacter sp.]|jgi:formate dehydrogenase subunit delta
MSAMRESVVRMANQIARNFAVRGDEEAAAATAEHIRKFWDPRMRAQAFALLAERENGLSDLARRALDSLAKDAAANHG